ncbi:hypothetical protein KXS07_34230 [Inquilinus limosus]|uniref:hypothetical protein n=1 Tax=Inquilinus limosus TaxID=171674 RepID=UPI003F17AF3C
MHSDTETLTIDMAALLYGEAGGTDHVGSIAIADWPSMTIADIFGAATTDVLADEPLLKASNPLGLDAGSMAVPQL